MVISCYIIIFLAWTLLCWFRRDLALALLILLLPTYQIRFTILWIPATLLEVCILLLTFSWLVRSIVKKERIVIPHAWLVLAFIASGAVAVATSVDIRAGLGLFKAYVLEPVLLYAVAVATIRTEKHVRYLQWACIALTLFIGLIALAQAVGFVSVPEPYASEHPMRVTSLFPFPTAIGKLLGALVAYSIVILFFAPSAWRAGYRKRIIGFGLAAGVGIASLVLSLNRGALLGVGVACIAVLFFSKKRALVFGLAVLAVVLLLCVPFIRQEAFDVASGQDVSTDVRLVMWQGTLRLLQAHPIFGSGLGGFPELYDQYRSPAHVELFPNPDQLALTLWVEMGIFGLAAFIALAVVWIREALRQLRSIDRTSGVWFSALGLFAALLAILGHGLVDTTYFKNDLAALFWLLFALLIAQRSITRLKNNNTQ